LLLARKDLFVRNLTNRMLGYALGRGLTRSDSCTVDSIVGQLAAEGYKSQALIEAIVMSPPFRYQAGRVPGPEIISSHTQQEHSQKEKEKPSTP
jgi:hypothetical protein